MRIVVALILISLLLAPALADVSKTIAVQGRLTNPAGNPLPGQHAVTFKIYDVETGGTALEALDPQNVMATNDGLFTTMIDVSILSFDRTYWLELTVGSETLSPRQRLTAAPYALGMPGIVNKNGNIGIGTALPAYKLHVMPTLPATVDAIFTTGDFVNGVSGSGMYIQFGNATGDTYTKINAFSGGSISNNNLILQAVGGNIGIGTTSPSQKLDVNGIVQMTGFKLPTSASNGYVLTSDASGVGTWQALSVTGGMAGSGTANYIPKFTGATTLGNSVIYETGGKVGIGATSPAQALDVNGTIRLSGLASAIQFGTSNGLTFQTFEQLGYLQLMDNKLITYKPISFTSDGTAAAPVLTWYTDLNTGILKPVDDAIAITTGGVERIRITNSGLCFGTDCRTSWPSSGGSGTVTSVATGSGLTGGTITASGTISVATGGITNAMLAGSITSDKITSLDWSKLTSVPTIDSSTTNELPTAGTNIAVSGTQVSVIGSPTFATSVTAPTVTASTQLCLAGQCKTSWGATVYTTATATVMYCGTGGCSMNCAYYIAGSTPWTACCRYQGQTIANCDGLSSSSVTLYGTGCTTGSSTLLTCATGKNCAMDCAYYISVTGLQMGCCRYKGYSIADCPGFAAATTIIC